MARIHRDAFVQQFRNLRIEAEAALPGGLDPSIADLDQDGFVEGEAELEALFYAVDDFDSNGMPRRPKPDVFSPRRARRIGFARETP